MFWQWTNFSFHTDSICIGMIINVNSEVLFPKRLLVGSTTINSVYRLYLKTYRHKDKKLTKTIRWSIHVWVKHSWLKDLANIGLN